MSDRYTVDLTNFLTDRQVAVTITPSQQSIPT